MTTVAVTMHRFVLSELNTHRAFSRNSASSRAIPLAKRIEQVRNDPAVPVHWGRNQPGMQADVELDAMASAEAERAWRGAALDAADAAEAMAALGLHKQVAARVLEPFLWHRVVISATDWYGFFAQRCSPLAQPEMRVAAEAIRDALAGSSPVECGEDDWHLPFVDPVEQAELSPGELRALSVARCARVSYLNEGKRDAVADLALFERLWQNLHLSPFEHVARPTEGATRGNFTGWAQLRHVLDLDALMLAAARQEGDGG